MPWHLRSVALLLMVGSDGHAAPRWNLGLGLGTAFSVPVAMVVRQEGSPDLRFTARWDTRGFQLPLYYAVRLARRHGERGWSVQLVHHKLFLKSPPPGVDVFAVSHGYNLLLVGRERLLDSGHFGLAAGAIVAHPENTVRGRALDQGRGMLGSGYYLSGPALTASVARDWKAGERVRPFVEAKLALAWARVPVEGGSADVPNVALHVIAGVGTNL